MGCNAGRKLLELEKRPTAIFCSNDEMAAGVLSVAHRMGLSVPEDLSVIGFDDSPTASHVWPALSTVHWPIREMGALAARVLVPDFLADRKDVALPENLVLKASFLERDSVGKAPER